MVSHTAVLALWLTPFFAALATAQIAGQCTGQSCYVAELAGSTPEPYKMKGGKKPTGGNPTGDRCIKENYKKLGLPPPEGLRRYLRGEAGLDSLSSPADFSLPSEFSSDATSEVEADALAPDQGSCKPVTILFGRGTTESGIPDALGGTVGPALRTQATKKGWAIEGIKYDASLAGIYCLGMPGGVACIDQLSKLVQRCPNTKVILSGYSQGAMVARICAAWSKEPAQKQIAGLALFGDPFNGAAVKGVPKENVKTWCTSGDGVCKGDFSISAAHLAYTSGSTISGAVSWMATKAQ